MASEECIRLIREAADLSDEELESLLTELQRRADARQATNELESLEERLFNAADELAQELEIAQAIERRNRAMNIMVKQDIVRQIEAAEDAVEAPSAGLLARMVGSNKKFARARQSTEARTKALQSQYLGGMIADLRREDLLPRLNAKENEWDIARELEETTKRDGNPGKTGNAEARRIAEIIDKYRKLALARENRAGAWKRPLEGYIAPNTHDMHRIRRAGFEEWRNAILPELDPRTFKGADPDEFLKSVHDALVSGRHLTSKGADENDLTIAFKGPGNLAKRVSQHRVLHWKDADAFMRYNERFGQRSLIESILRSFEFSARNTALMESFGPNPRAMFDTIRREMADRYRTNDVEQRRFQGQRFQNIFDELDGTSLMADPENITRATAGATIRAIQSMAKLGASVWSAFPDITFKAAELRRQGGRTLLDGYRDSLTSWFDGMSRNVDRRVAMDRLGAGIDGMRGNIAARFSVQDNLPGRMAKMQQIFFKFNLLGPWTDSHRRGLGFMMANDLAAQKALPFDQIDPQARALLETYGMTPEMWDIARRATETLDDGREYLFPDLVQNLDIPGKSGRQAQRMRDEVETMIRSYLADRAEFAVPTSGAREQSFVKFGTRPGTGIGEATRFFMQFKTFPTLIVMRQLGGMMEADSARDFFRNLRAGKGDLLGLTQMIVGTTLLGYVSMSAKDILKGREPRPVDNKDTWFAAMTQGGGLGIYGDFLFGQSNRFGQDIFSTMAGPAFGAGSDLYDVFAALRDGEPWAADAVRFVQSNTPFANLFYTKIALDYLILYQLQESINPGYLRRMERNIKNYNKQEFILPPSSAIPRGGGSRLLEGVR